MKISALKRQSLASLKGNWGVAVGLTVIYFLLNFVLSIGSEIILSGGFSEWISQEETPLSASIVSTLINILLIPFSVSVTWFYLSIIRNENPVISQTFFIYKDGKTSLKLIGMSILQGIFVFLWSLLLLIPGIVKALAYSQSFYILRDNPNYTVLEAITESRKRMNGLKGKYFLLNLSFIGWGILCLFTFGIGLLWLIPYVYTTLAAFYNELISNKNENNIEVNKF